MTEITQTFTDQEKAQEFSDLIWKILCGELTESDDSELQRYIDFYNDNDHCEMIIRKAEGGAEIGIAVAKERPLDDFEDWGNAN